MSETRSVGVRGLIRVRMDESPQRKALRELLEHHRVTEQTARYWARRYASTLWRMGLANLAFEDEFMLTIAEAYQINSQHVVFFVQFVREWLRWKETDTPRTPKPHARVWKSLEMQRIERAERA